MNTPAVREFVARTGATMDPPDTVAHTIANAIAPQLADRSFADASGQKRWIARNTA